MQRRHLELSTFLLLTLGVLGAACGGGKGTNGTAATGGASASTSASSASSGGGNSSAATGGASSASSASSTSGTSTSGSSSSTSTGTGGSAPAMNLCPDSITGPKNANSVVVTDATLTADTTWTADKVWLLYKSLDVDGYTLTIEAGAVVCFGPGAQLTVGPLNPSAILVKGTAAKHVTFTAADDGTGRPDFWGGVLLNQYGASTVSYLDIFYAALGGGTPSWAFEIVGVAGTPLLLDHLTVSGVRAKGLRLGPAGVAPNSVIAFDGFYPAGSNPPSVYGPAIEVQAEASATLNDPSVTLTLDVAKIPAPSRFIRIDASAGVTKSLTWNDLGLPYAIPDNLSFYGDYTTNTVVTLTVNAGVTLALDGNLIIGNRLWTNMPDLGNLVVKGTAAKPVVFTSPNPAPAAGDWGSVVFFDGPSYEPLVSKIDHAQFLYGAGSFVYNLVPSCQDKGDSGEGLIGILGSGSYDGPSITNSLFSHSLGDGIRTSFNPTNLTVDVINQNYGDPKYGNTFMNIAHHPFLDPKDPSANLCP